MIDSPSIFKLIRKASVLVRVLLTFAVYLYTEHGGEEVEYSTGWLCKVNSESGKKRSVSR